MKYDFKKVNGGVCAAKGFSANGVPQRDFPQTDLTAE